MYRLIFIADSGVQTVNGTATVEHLDMVDQATVLKAARDELEQQWPGEDRQYYQQPYDQGVATLNQFEQGQLDHALVKVEYGWLFITP